MNSTLTGYMINGSIPLSVTVNASTNWLQFLMTIAITLIGSFGLIILIYFPQIWSSLKAGGLLKIAKFTRRNVIMIKHTESSLFAQSMIDQRCYRDLTAAMNKMGGEDFDLVLHTPGGEIFSSLSISRLIKQYPGHIRAIIPMYSMSGGSLLALSCKELLMAPNACIGPIDPQLGSLFRFGSAAAWDKIVKFKGKKAEDQSISFAMMGRQYTKSIHNHLTKTIDFDLSNKQREKMVKFLTDGSIEHAYPLTITDLKGFGIDVNTISDTKFLHALSKFVTSSGKEGVNFYKLSKWRKRLYGKS